MANKKEYNESRRNIAFAIAILLGLGIGMFIKRVSIGIIIGLAIGLFASVFSRKE
jgi:F0F1-type ATP synthase assembly protein I